MNSNLKNILVGLFFFCAISALSLESAAQEKTPQFVVFSIADLTSDDYYLILKENANNEYFEISEACIPIGLIAFHWKKEYTRVQMEAFIEVAILKATSKKANVTELSIEEMRTSCSDFRKNLIHE